MTGRIFNAAEVAATHSLAQIQQHPGLLSKNGRCTLSRGSYNGVRLSGLIAAMVSDIKKAMQTTKSEKILSAKEARAISMEQSVRLQQRGHQLHPSDAAIAERLIDQCLEKIRRQAGEGKTEAVYSITEWTIWARDRGEVLQQLTRQIDSLGFNLLVERSASVFGKRITYKIEW